MNLRISLRRQGGKDGLTNRKIRIELMNGILGDSRRSGKQCEDGSREDHSSSGSLIGLSMIDWDDRSE